jgi:hypothetical protein
LSHRQVALPCGLIFTLTIDPMDKPTLIAGVVIEVVALIVIVRLWMRRPSRIASSVFWSAVLLVPFCGLFIYFFLRNEPGEHGESRLPNTVPAAIQGAGLTMAAAAGIELNQPKMK